MSINYNETTTNLKQNNKSILNQIFLLLRVCLVKVCLQKNTKECRTADALSKGSHYWILFIKNCVSLITMAHIMFLTVEEMKT